MIRPLASPIAEIVLFGAPAEEEREPADALERAVAEARGKQRLHFLAGRAAARAALRQLAIEEAPLAVGAGGEVVWPAGITGSVSHTRGLAVAAVADARRALGVGIDVERVDRVLRSTSPRHVATQAELDWLASPPPMPADPLMMLVSAKEVVFKAYFMATGLRLGFHDAELTPDAGGLLARVLVPVSAPGQMHVRVLRDGEHLVALGALIGEDAAQ